MKRSMALLMSAALAGLVGCGKEGTTGGPGAGDPNAKTPMGGLGRTENTFAVTTSSMSAKPGGAATSSSIGIKRGSGFDLDVTVEFADLPKGVTVEPAKLSIPRNTSEAKFNATAAFETAPGEYTVRVVGKATSGPDSTGDFKLTVSKPDSFTLNPPGNALWAAGIKQGETKNFAVSVNRDKDFRDDVTLKFDGLPKGVTVETASPVNKNGEAEAKVVIKAADDAPEGKYVVKVTGQPAKGAAVTQDMNLTVSKK